MCASAAVWAMMEGIVCGARIEDMADHRKRNGNDEWLWRTISIPASEVLEKGDPKLAIAGGFMRDECRKLFHSK